MYTYIYNTTNETYIILQMRIDNIELTIDNIELTIWCIQHVGEPACWGAILQNNL